MQQQQQQPGGPAAPINARVARGISGLFGQSLLADCQLVFVQERGLLGQQPGPHGAASSSTRAPPGRELGLGQRCGEPLPAHSIVLRFASDKLAAQVGARVSAALCGGKGGQQGRVCGLGKALGRDQPRPTRRGHDRFPSSS